MRENPNGFNGEGRKYARVNHNCYLWPLMPHCHVARHSFPLKSSHLDLRMFTTFRTKTSSLLSCLIRVLSLDSRHVHANFLNETVFLAVSRQSVGWKLFFVTIFNNFCGIFSWQKNKKIFSSQWHRKKKILKLCRMNFNKKLIRKKLKIN